MIIEQVQPQVDGGLYPAKRTVGEQADISAHIFADGHDHIRARVAFRAPAKQEWHAIELQHVGNDEWQAYFDVTETGRYTFKIEAWVDHFETWYDGFVKKANARVDVQLELREGAEFLKRLSATDKTLLSAVRKLEAKETGKAIDYILSKEFADMVHRHPLVDNVSTSAEYTILSEREKARFSSWYEFFPRSASLQPGKHGTFLDAIKLLPRVAAMGFDVLYFPPIHPIGKVNRKGKNNNVRSLAGEPGSPWAIGSDEGGHKDVLPQLGTLADYRALIGEARKLGIDIALDLAFQCAPDHPYVKQHPEWFRQRPDGSIQYAENPPKKYQDIYPFNFETDHWQALWEELKSVIIFWIEQGVTIFRVDNPHTKPIPFWQWAIAEVHQTHPDVIFLSEAFTRPKVMASLAKVGFTQGYTYFTWRVSKQEIIDYVNELTQGPSRNYFRPNFWPNTPDILPWHLQHQGENIFIIRLALAATLSSSYGIYGPSYEFNENTPVDGREEYLNSEKYEVRHYDWKKTNRMTDIISLLNRIRKENKALHYTWNIQFCAVDNPNLLAFYKSTHDDANKLLVVVNLDAQQTHSGYVQLPLQRLGVQGYVNLKLHDLITNEHYTWTQEWNFVQLNPAKMPFHIFKLSVHTSNM